MGGHNDTTRTCSVCRGQGVLRALHSKRECLICDNKYESVTLNNRSSFILLVPQCVIFVNQYV